MAGYLKHIQLTKQLEDKAKEAARNRQLAEEQITMAQGLLAGAKKVDADVGAGQGMVEEATAAVGAKDYKLALEKATMAVMTLREAYRGRINAFIDSSASLLASAEQLGNPGEVKDALAAAREALGKGELDSAVEQAKRSWKASEKVVHEHLSSSFSQAQNFILVSKSQGRDTAGAEDLLSRARAVLEKNDYTQALAFTKEGLDILLGDLDGELKARRTEVQGILQNLTSLSLPTDRVKTLLERTDGDIKGQQYDKAFASLKQAKVEGEKLLQKGLEGSTAALEAPLREAEEMGAEIAKARDFLRTAQASLRQGNSQGALTAIADFRKALDEAKFQKILNTISQSKGKFISARNLGLDTTQAVGLLNQAREALQKGIFTEALRLAQRGDQELDAMVGAFSVVDKEAKAVEAEVASAEAQGCDLASARRFIDAARTEAVARHADGARAQLVKAVEEVARARSDRSMEIVEECQFLITLGQRMGLGLEGEMGALDGCQDSFRRKDFSEALETATHTKGLLEGKLSQFVSKRMENARTAAATAKVDQERVSALLTKASTALGVKDFENSLSLTDEAFRIASAGLQESVRAMFEALRAGAELLKALGKEATVVREGLAKAEPFYSEGRFGEVPSLAAPGLEFLQGQGEALFEGVKAQVVQLKNLNADIEAMKELLRAAKTSLQGGEPLKALVPLKECWDEAARALAAYQEAKDALASTAVAAAEGKKKGAEMANVVAALLEAKKALEAGDFKKTIEITRDARSEGERQGNLLEAQRAIVAARDQVELGAQLGVVVDSWRTNLDEAKEILKGKDFTEGLRRATEVQEGVQKLIRDQLSTEVSRAGNMVTELKGLGFDVRAFEDRVARAREAQGNADIRTTADVTRALISDMEALKGRFKTAQEATERLKGSMADLSAMGLDTSGADKPLRKAEKFLGDGRFEEAVRAATDGLRELDEERQDMVGRTIGQFERLVANARDEGTNTRSAEAYLKKARELIGQGQMKEAITLAMQSETELERMELQRDIAQKSLAAAKNKFAGVPLAAEVKAILVEAEKAFNSGDFAKVLDLSLRAGDEFSQSEGLFGEVNELMEGVAKVREMTVRMGGDPTKLDEVFGEAQTLLERGGYVEAKKAAERAREAGLEICSTRLGQLFSDLRGYMVLCSLMNVPPGNADEKLSMAMAHLDKGDLENALGLINEGTRLCEAALMAKVSETVGNAKAAVAYARKIGAKTEAADDFIKQAQEALEEKHFDKAAMLAQRATEAVEAQKDVEKRFVDTTYQADSLIKSAKKFGIDAREPERALLQALELKRTDPNAAIVVAEEALAKARSALDNFSPKVEATLEVKGTPQPGWQDAEVVVRNDGKALAKDLSLQILGDIEVEGMKPLPILRAQGVERIPVRVKFAGRGKIPIILKAKAVRVLDGRDYEAEKIQEIEVGVKEEEAKGPHKIIADFDTRCLVCRGTIKKGFAATECSCNSLFHEMCAKRSGKCPVCGKGLTGS